MYCGKGDSKTPMLNASSSNFIRFCRCVQVTFHLNSCHIFMMILNFIDPVVINVSNHQSETLYPNQRYCESLRQIDKVLWSKADQFPGIAEIKSKLRKEYGINNM